MRDDANSRFPDPDAVPAASSSDIPADRIPEAECTISAVAREFGVTLRTLRFYESEGLLSPRREGTTRIYEQSDRNRLAAILKAKKLGFALAEIRQMVGAECGSVDAIALALSEEKCLEQIDFLLRRKAEIEVALGELRQIFASACSKMTEAKDIAPEPTPPLPELVNRPHRPHPPGTRQTESHYECTEHDRSAFGV